MSKSIHPAIGAGKTAVITGGASGIGLAAAKTFAGLGMKIALIDLGPERRRSGCRCDSWRHIGCAGN
jgi:NAD(P)-dependent dehydrogenase (short-subunit alcohol dehydrogenase family)